MDPAENHFYKDYLWKGTCTVDLLEFGRMNGKIMVVLIACGRICEFRLQMQPRMVKKNSKKKKWYDLSYHTPTSGAHSPPYAKVEAYKSFHKFIRKKNRE